MSINDSAQGPCSAQSGCGIKGKWIDCMALRRGGYGDAMPYVMHVLAYLLRRKTAVAADALRAGIDNCLE